MAHAEEKQFDPAVLGEPGAGIYGTLFHVRRFLDSLSNPDIPNDVREEASEQCSYVMAALAAARAHAAKPGAKTDAGRRVRNAYRYALDRVESRLGELLNELRADIPKDDASPGAPSDLLEAAETIAEISDYLKTALDNGDGIEESRWLDGLMMVHGILLDHAAKPDALVDAARKTLNSAERIICLARQSATAQASDEADSAITQAECDFRTLRAALGDRNG